VTPRSIGPHDFLVPLATIHAECFADAWSLQSLGALLSADNTIGLGLDDGFILIRSAGSEAEILTLAVRSAARRRGLGAELITAGAQEAANRGAQAMFLEVGENNKAAQMLYSRMGFATVGRRKGYYVRPGSPPEDAFILRSNLPLSPLGKSFGTG